MNILISIILVIFGIALWKMRGQIGNENLDAIEKIASIMAFLIAILVLIFPSLSNSTPEPDETAILKSTVTLISESITTLGPIATLIPESTNTPTTEPTATLTPQPTATSTTEPTNTPTLEPTETFTPKPTATSTTEPTATPDPILFADDFDNGSDDRWEFGDCKWTMVDESFRPSPCDATSSFLYLIDSSWTDYEVEFTAKSFVRFINGLVPDRGNGIEVGVRVQEGNDSSGSWALISTIRQACYEYDPIDGLIVHKDIPTKSGISKGNHKIKVIARGDIYKFYVDNDTQICSFESQGYASGGVVLKVTEHGFGPIIIDDFVVRKIDIEE